MSAKIINFPVRQQPINQEREDFLSVKVKGRERNLPKPVKDRQREETEEMFPPDYFMLVE